MSFAFLHVLPGTALNLTDRGFGWKVVWSWNRFLDSYLELTTNAVWIFNFIFSSFRKDINFENVFLFLAVGQNCFFFYKSSDMYRITIDIIQTSKQLFILLIVHHSFCFFTWLVFYCLSLPVKDCWVVPL